MVAALTGIDASVFGPAVAEARRQAPADAPSTLHQTILQRATRGDRYGTLVTGPGEPYVRAPRHPAAGGRAARRTTARRSLLYLGHLSDLHVIDSESPGRIEPMIVREHEVWGSAFHPQDALTVHVVAAMAKAFADLQ